MGRTSVQGGMVVSKLNSHEGIVALSSRRDHVPDFIRDPAKDRIRGVERTDHNVHARDGKKCCKASVTDHCRRSDIHSLAQLAGPGCTLDASVVSCVCESGGLPGATDGEIPKTDILRWVHALEIHLVVEQAWLIASMDVQAHCSVDEVAHPRP